MKVKDILSVIDKDNVVFYVEEKKIRTFLKDLEFVPGLTGYYRDYIPVIITDYLSDQPFLKSKQDLMEFIENMTIVKMESYQYDYERDALRIIVE